MVSEFEAGTVAIVSLVVGVLCGGLFGVTATNTGWKNRAVESGHAEFYLDEDNNRQWRWLEAECTP